MYFFSFMVINACPSSLPEVAALQWDSVIPWQGEQLFSHLAVGCFSQSLYNSLEVS